MSDWINWLTVAGIVVVLELFSGTFYLLMIALGLACGALAAWCGLPVSVQLIAAALVASVATVALRRSRFGMRQKVDASRDPNVNLDIGQSIDIHKWASTSGATYSARAMYRGAHWDVVYAGSDVPHAGMFEIIEMRGSQLIVRQAERGRE